MQRILGSGNGGQRTGLEHHYLEITQTAGQQAVEGGLQGRVVVLQIHHQEGDLWRLDRAQVGLNTLTSVAVRGCSSNGREHLPRR
ncbi:hypothetical protein D3C81_1841050 [compost metagenome]